jgi:hypothetical protein
VGVAGAGAAADRVRDHADAFVDEHADPERVVAAA